jgi:hypothetical protein
MEINENIKKKLHGIGEDYDILKPFMQEYLTKVESYIESRTKDQNETIKTLKECGFTVSSVSKELGCSRTTLYNHNQLLKRYIEHSMVVLNQDNPYAAYENLRESKSKLQEQVSLMENRDIDFELVKHEKIELSIMLKEKNKEIERLHARVNELSAELHQIKNGNNNINKGRIVSLK